MYFTEWSLGIQWRMEARHVLYRLDYWGEVENEGTPCTLESGVLTYSGVCRRILYVTE